MAPLPCIGGMSPDILDATRALRLTITLEDLPDSQEFNTFHSDDADYCVSDKKKMTIF